MQVQKLQCHVALSSSRTLRNEQFVLRFGLVGAVSLSSSFSSILTQRISWRISDPVLPLPTVLDRPCVGHYRSWHVISDDGHPHTVDRTDDQWRNESRSSMSFMSLSKLQHSGQMEDTTCFQLELDCRSTDAPTMHGCEQRWRLEYYSLRFRSARIIIERCKRLEGTIMNRGIDCF